MDTGNKVFIYFTKLISVIHPDGLTSPSPPTGPSCTKSALNVTHGNIKNGGTLFSVALTAKPIVTSDHVSADVIRPI